MVALPDVVPLRHAKELRELTPIEHVRKRISLLGRPQDARRVALDLLVLVQEAEEGLERATVRAWLEGAGLEIDSSTRKRRSCGGPTSPTVTSPSRSRKAIQVPTSRAYAEQVRGASRRSMRQ
jgi:hypothetical protein